MKSKTYIAIDLKSFYASVECVERGIDPLDSNLVVADSNRTNKTICLAVSPSLKTYGIPGRARLFEVEQKVAEINAERRNRALGQVFTGSSWKNNELITHPELALDYIIAPPRMAYYIKYSTQIYEVYLKYIASEDIHVYSIDEVFIDATEYLDLYGLSARELAMKMILEVLKTTGITATVGIGTNLYLAKVAMDIRAKHLPADENGVRIAEFDEMSYRIHMWDHRPLTDFWRIGKGYAKKLESHGIYTMGDIARCSEGLSNELYNEDLLYKLFGINAELLIDHAWGWEPCTMQDIKNYRPHSNSLGAGQVLQEPYTWEKARIIVWEMTDQLVLDMVEKGLVTNHMVLMVGYDKNNLIDSKLQKVYKGPVRVNHFGQKVTKPAHSSINLGSHTSSSKKILKAVIELFDRIVDPLLLVRRVSIAAVNIMPATEVPKHEMQKQLDLFTDYESLMKDEKKEEEELSKEAAMQHTMLKIKNKYGKNAIFKGINLKEGATAIQRNQQIGGHKA